MIPVFLSEPKKTQPVVLLSGDQTLLWLPAPAETPVPAHRSATAAGLHAGRAQAQDHLLA